MPVPWNIQQCYGYQKMRKERRQFKHTLKRKTVSSSSIPTVKTVHLDSLGANVNTVSSSPSANVTTDNVSLNEASDVESGTSRVRPQAPWLNPSRIWVLGHTLNRKSKTSCRPYNIKAKRKAPVHTTKVGMRAHQATFACNNGFSSN